MEIITTIGIIFLWMILYYAISIIVSMGLFVWISDKYHIKVKRPKSKKYLTKVDPIYEIKRGPFYDDETFIIQKWSLSWVEKLGYIFLTSPLIYPINVSVWKYETDSYLYIGDEVKVKDLHAYLKEHNLTLREYFEIEQEKINEKERIENEQVKSFENMINNLNKEFNENYE